MDSALKNEGKPDETPLVQEQKEQNDFRTEIPAKEECAQLQTEEFPPSTDENAVDSNQNVSDDADDVDGADGADAADASQCIVEVSTQRATPAGDVPGGENSSTPPTPAQPLQQPLQPYVYPPPYPYYPHMPSYMAPNPAVPPPQVGGSSGSNDYMMTGPLNPYHYTDASSLGDPTPDTRRNRGGVTEPFPEKLHRMLEACEREGAQDVVSFFSHGRAFSIHKPRRFVSEVMPRFFRQTRLTSFQRQLNLYGFRRISQGPDNGGYYHELFLKGRPGLCVNMKRTKVKGNAKLKRDPDSEPNFYSYPPVKTTGNSTVPTPPQQPPSHPQPQPQLLPVTGAALQPPQSPMQQQSAPSVNINSSTSSPTPATPVATAQPAQSYPQPQYPAPYYPFPPVPTAAPYTAAQQNASVYPYPPPYYGYPWYPPQLVPPHPPAALSPQASHQTTPCKQTTLTVSSGGEVKSVSDSEEKSTPSGMEVPSSVEAGGSPETPSSVPTSVGV